MALQIIKKNDGVFKLPICYLLNNQEIEKHVKTDLELENSSDKSSLYNNVFETPNVFGKHTALLWCDFYTSDKLFLIDSQKMIKRLCKSLNNSSESGTEIVETDIANNTVKIWNEIHTETGFYDKYQYVEIDRFKWLNNSGSFLQLLSLYSMASPIISLAMPVFLLILPFFILKVQGKHVSFAEYVEILKFLFSKHNIGHMFNLTGASWDKIIYSIVSIIFYVLQVYQNTRSCISYHKNMVKIHTQLFTIKSYIERTLFNMDALHKVGSDLPTFFLFFDANQFYKSVLCDYLSELESILPNKLSFSKIKQIGHVMKCFYQLYKNLDYQMALEYSFGLNGYISNLRDLCIKYQAGVIGKCKFSKKRNDNTSFENAFHPSIATGELVKNTYSLNKSIILTGPNAAGKTTLLKSTIFNVILSQQMGFGFYKKAIINPYDKIHCYINIPDTSGRDSLFQAEARRCKDILDEITKDTKYKRHLCVFDELYSGTNPYEAIGSAYAFLEYISKKNNVNFVLTTHYTDLCTRMEKCDGVSNFHMGVESDDLNEFKYTYKLRENISKIKGGVKVLKDLLYPSEIVECARKVINDVSL